MFNTLKNIYSQFLEVFNKLTLFQKISIVVAVLAVVVSVVVLVLWANKPVYTVLFADLEKNDAADVVTFLKDNNIPYELSSEGTTISVPKETVYETRLQLAQEGLPRGGSSGFELFDKSSFGMTEFVQNVNYQRALQGELSRTISSLKEVEKARVHLTIPKDRLFVSDETAAKAAVVIDMRGGQSIGRDQVKAIASLVAGSVKGLSIENVRIVDTDGRLLSEFLDEENSPLLMTQTQLEYQKKVESSLRNKVNSILSRTMGIDNAVAQVNVEMNFDKKTVTKEEFDPNPVLRSQRTIQEESTNAPSKQQGVPGVQSNLAEPDIGNEGQVSTYNKLDETQNFEVGKTVVREEKSLGAVKRITVAVVVDDKRQVTGEGENRQVEYVQRSPEELEKIRNLVATAVGYNEERGDIIEVSNISFDTSKDEVVQSGLIQGVETTRLVSTLIKYGIGLIIIILFYFLVIRKIMKRLSEYKTGEAVAAGGGAGEGIDFTVGEDIKFPKTIEELEKEIESELDENAPVDTESVKNKVMLRKIEDAAKEDPEMIANLIKVWLRE